MLNSKENITFLWNTPLIFEPTKKYLIYFRGAFSPATRGHYDLIEPYKNMENVSVLLSQMKSSERHGLSFKKRLKIWSFYLRDYKNVTISPMTSSNDLIPHLKGIDVVVYLKGNENPKLIGQKSTKRFLKAEKDFLKERSSLLPLLNEKKIHLVAQIFNRPAKNALSATKFIAAVKGNKREEELRFFVPMHISEEEFHKIVSLLKNCLSLH